MTTVVAFSTVGYAGPNVLHTPCCPTPSLCPPAPGLEETLVCVDGKLTPILQGRQGGGNKRT